jgi:hypothetical protein
MTAKKDMTFREILDKAKELKSELEIALCKLSEANEPVDAQLAFWEATDRMKELRGMVDAEVTRQLKVQMAAGVQNLTLRAFAYLLSQGDERGFTRACCAVRAEIARLSKAA